MTLAVTSNSMPMTRVEDMVETRVAQKISQVSGVGLVTLAGGQRPAVRVKLNAQAVAALGLTSETVRTAITGANVNSAKGSLDGPERAVTLSANDQMQSADEYRRLIIAYQNGAPVRLGDVATVEQGAENSWLGAWANQAPAIVMNVQRQRRQYHCDSGQHSPDAAPAYRKPAKIGEGHGPVRSHHQYSRFRARYPV